MHTGIGQVVELVLKDGERLVRVSGPPNMIPTPGQYLLASHSSDSPLPVPIFYTDSAADGFIAAPRLNNSWKPGHTLHLRGPLGRGFELPISARRVALVSFDGRPVRLRGLIGPALRQDAAVVLVCDFFPDRLPDEVEVQPVSALTDVMSWAEYVAVDVARENLEKLFERLRRPNPNPSEEPQRGRAREIQVLIRTDMPCGGMAECGVCAVSLKVGWQFACKEGPVFNWRDLA